jgi:hypothetical protein
MLQHRLQGAEFFRASSPTSRCVVHSQTPPYSQQSLPLLRGRQSDRRCGCRKAKIKHQGCPGTRRSRRPRGRRWRRDCRPHPVNRPACNQMKGQAFRRGSRRPRKVKLSESPAVWRCAQGQNEETRLRSLATTSEPSLCLTTNAPSSGRTLRPRFLRRSTIVHLKVGSEPSSLATSSAMNSNPVSVGSGCSPRDEARRYARCIG